MHFPAGAGPQRKTASRQATKWLHLTHCKPQSEDATKSCDDEMCKPIKSTNALNGPRTRGWWVGGGGCTGVGGAKPHAAAVNCSDSVWAPTERNANCRKSQAGKTNWLAVESRLLHATHHSTRTHTFSAFSSCQRSLGKWRAHLQTIRWKLNFPNRMQHAT